MAKEWYVVHVLSGYEKKIQSALETRVENLKLQDKITKVKIPTIEVPEVKNGKKSVRTKKIFPGYLLIEMELTDETWQVVKSINGITNFVGSFGMDKPKPLSRDEVNSLFDKMGEQKKREKTSALLEFSPGEHVKVVDGPFNNFNGVIEEVYPDKGRLRIKVEIFGRGTPVELSFLQVDKI